jgi:spermidine/putrescine transport system permease protein
MTTAAPSAPRSRGWRAPKFALAVPSIVWYVLFFVAPIAFIVVYSFATKDTSKRIPVSFDNFTLSNYSEVFNETSFKTFRRTLRISVLATTLCVVIGLPVAYFLAFKVREKWRAILLAMVVVPSFTSFLIRTLAWRIPFAPKGTLSTWLQDIGLLGAPINVLETATAVQIAVVYNYLGFMILPLFVALDRIDAGMREASKDLGAGKWATFFGVTLPLAAPGIAAGTLLTFIPMCGDYVTATILGGAKGNMIGALIDSKFKAAQNWPLGSAMAVLMIAMVLVTLIVCSVVVWVLPRLVRLASPAFAGVKKRIYERGLSATARNKSGGDWLKVLLAVWCAVVLLFLFLPIALVVLHSFNGSNSFTIWNGSPTVKWWGELFRADRTWSMLVRFVVIAGAAALLPRLVGARGAKNRALARWSGAVGLLVAVLWCGWRTAWYRDIFRNAGVGDALRNSFLSAIGATVIAVVLGGTAGVALARRPGGWTKVFMATIFLILVTPEIMDAIALAGWMERLPGPFNNDFGPLNSGIFRLWVGQSLYASAVVTLIVRARLSGLDESLEEAAADLGAPPARAFRQITLPLITSALVAGALLSFTLCLDNTIISQLISGGGSSTFPVALLSAAKSTIKPFWGAGAVILFGVTLASLWFVFSVLKRSGDSSSQIAATLAGG